jgi:hypothetical protein
MLARSLVIAGVGFSLCACEAAYVQPDASQLTAELNLRSGRTQAFDRNGFKGFSTQLCEDKKGEGPIVDFNGPYGQSTVRVPAGVRFYLLGSYAVVQSVNTSAGVVDFSRCKALISFVPEASRKYEARQTSDLKACPISLVDAATRQPVPYEVHEPGELCRK